jgi:hypothetical protein
MINRDCAYDLRKAYFQALSGITYNSQAVSVYDEIVPNGAIYPCIVLSNQLSRGVRSKDNFQRDATIEICVYQKYTSDEGGKKEVNDIANLIIARIITSNNTYGFSQYLTTWQVINCEYQTNSLILQLPTGWQVEQTILFSQLLNQLN